MGNLIDVYDYMFWGDYNKRISELASLALPESWSFANKSDNSILKNYLKYTFFKLQEEDKVWKQISIVCLILVYLMHIIVRYMFKE